MKAVSEASQLEHITDASGADDVYIYTRHIRFQYEVPLPSYLTAGNGNYYNKTGVLQLPANGKVE